MKKNKKKLIIGIVLVFVLIAIGVYLFLIIAKKNDTYLIFNDSGAFKYEDNKWTTFNNEEDSIFDKQFNVYIDNEYKGRYEIRYVNDMWYYFDENNDSQDFSGELFAYNSKDDITLANIKKQEIDKNDIFYINDILTDADIKMDINDYYRINEKVNFDIDSDGNEETIYAISNADVMENQDKVFSTVFYVKNNKVHTLKLDVYDSDEENYYLYSINNLFELEKNGKYYLSINQFSDMTNVNNGTLLYQLNISNQYKLLISSNDRTADQSNKNRNNSIFIILIPVIILAIVGYLFYKKVIKEEID